ncbi:MAG: FtsX-like permease family protein [Oscillospiraceae bacterium]|nr:FtsX-like permease family protein [Oscillospiraceae bacterium]
MSKALFKSTLRAIKYSFSRFVSIVIIVAVGISFFVGFKSGGPDMRATANQYFLDNNLMDIRVQSSLGLTPFDLRELAKIEGVDYLMPAKFVDALVWVNGNVESDIDGSQISARAYGLNLQKFADFCNGTNDGNFINRPTLVEGRYPTAKNECLVDRSKLSTPDSYQIGSTVRLDGGADGDSIFASLDTNEFVIVGVIESPYYLSFERGNTLVGSGKVGTFIYVPEDAFVTDYYTEVYITVKDADRFDAFSQEYFNHLVLVMNEIEKLSQERLAVRANDLNAKLPAQIVEAELQLTSVQAEIDARFGDAKTQLDELKQLVDNGSAIYAQKKREFDEKFGTLQTEINKGGADLQAQINNYNYESNRVAQARLEWNTADAALKEIQRRTASSFSDFEKIESQLAMAQTSVDTTRTLLNTTQGVFESLAKQQQEQLNNPDIQNILGLINDFNPELFASIQSLGAGALALSAMQLVNQEAERIKLDLTAKEQELNIQKSKYDAAKPQVDKLKTQIATAENELASKRTLLDAAEAKLTSVKNVIESYSSQLSSASTDLLMNYTTAQGELILLKNTVDTAPETYEKMKQSYDESVAEAEKEIKLAETKIAGAKSLLGKVGGAKWHVYDRNDTPGYESYSNAIDTVQMVSNVFPVFFVLIAALISLTTITRMVEEDRTQFGTLFALGYQPRSVAMKYIYYALFASIVGSALGLGLGFYVIPKIIFYTWSIMFEMPELIITFPVQYVAIGLLVAMLSTVAAAVFACRKDIRVNPAVLMRPKAPEPGKRVFLERVGFVWKRLGFTSKVTVRNLFRNPKRFFMTLVGMSGCTALLLAATGFYGSVADIMTKQYGSGGIAKYDMQFVFSEAQTSGGSDVLGAITRDSRVASAMLVSMQSFEGGSDRIDEMHDVYVYIPEDAAMLGEYVNLQNRKDKISLTLGDGDVFVTEKFARSTDTRVGDTVFVLDTEGNKTELTVSGIVENYTFSYIYISPSVYQGAFGEDAKYTYAVGKLAEQVKADAATAPSGVSTDKSQLAVDLMAHEGINAVAFTTDTMNMFSEIVRTISLLVMLFIAAAIILAFVVLYNLSNININERTRELATLKVVGFYDNEVSDYIHRENYFMTAISTVLGLVFGIGLHRMIVNFTEVDMVMFGRTVHWFAFVIAAALSILFSILVNLIMRRKIRKVSMVESFQSVE